ncbi:hypothetical protein M9H77_07417 [Catharanthus roseus]|uniref:Uncharacterized protein n=1 Tax=Catharanthus roseus TaxID=4058 RepID=A0ACC0BV51_CATRO|nr:hypothetical protein M9H77_07417 [Catharanthus roseus]
MSTQGYHDMLSHNPYPIHEGRFQGRPQARGGRRGGQGKRGYYRPYEEVPIHEAWHANNLFDDFGEDPNDNGIVAYMEEVLKNKFEGFGDQGEASKLLSICSISKDHSMKQLEEENWLSVGEGYPTGDNNLTPTITGRLLDKKVEKFMPYHLR